MLAKCGLCKIISFHCGRKAIKSKGEIKSYLRDISNINYFFSRIKCGANFEFDLNLHAI